MLNIIQNTLWPRLLCSLLSFILRKTSKNRWNEIPNSKFSLFSKTCVFNNVLGVTEEIFKLALNLLEYFLEPNIIILDVVNTRYYEKKKAKVLYSNEKIVFLKQISEDLLGPTETIFTLCNEWQKRSWKCMKFPMSFHMLGSTRQKAKNFLHWNVSQFFKMFCSEQPIGFLRSDLFLHQNCLKSLWSLNNVSGCSQPWWYENK